MKLCEIEILFLDAQDELADAEKINQNITAELILNRLKIITFIDTKEIYYWNKQTGIYEPFESDLNAIIQFLCGEKTTTHLKNEIIDSIRRQTGISREVVGQELNLIPLNNGVYNFETQEFMPHTPDYVFISKHPINYKPQAEFDPLYINEIDEFLNKVCETNTDVILCKEMIGYCFYRSMPFQNIFIIYGKGGNGKGVLLRIIERLIGSNNMSSQSIQAIAENRFAGGYLYMKSANIFGDLPKKALEDTSLLKQLSGGDLISCEQKFKNPFTFHNYAKIIASCNEVPETPDTSDGFFDRQILFNFPNRIRDTLEEVREYDQVVCTEDNLSHFFNTCIDAFRNALNDNSFIRKETLEEKKAKYLAYSNSAIAYCQDELEYDPDSDLKVDDIWARYVSFCERQKIPNKNDRTFFQHVYKFFGNRVYKKRRSESRMGEDDLRYYTIVGLCFRESSAKTSNQNPI